MSPSLSFFQIFFQIISLEKEKIKEPFEKIVTYIYRQDTFISIFNFLLRSCFLMRFSLSGWNSSAAKLTPKALKISSMVQ
jgi:hypothetical protein